VVKFTTPAQHPTTWKEKASQAPPRERVSLSDQDCSI
jgi:hypothetical protein